MDLGPLFVHVWGFGFGRFHEPRCWAVFLQLPLATTTGLHTIVAQCCQSFDYPTALATVNSLVSTGSFTVLSEFLPGVKVLIQVASQLGVYVDGRSGQ